MKEKLNGRGPNTVKPNEFGYYEATIRSNKKIYSCNFLLKSGDIIEVSKKLHPIITKNNILKSKMWPLIPLHLQIDFKTLYIY